ncbi:hypothetical protein [Amycolatopsis sp. NPDC051071]|uniref:hypothetical protein n=1 Tax=Amycolatopsis sp. NPDC051071 TaxID=3154637 RepID=UPI00342013C8
MNKTRKVLVTLSMAAVTLLGAGAAADAAPGRTVSMTGRAELDTQDPLTTFEFMVHAKGNGRTGDGVVWMAHHVGDQLAWLVARVDCVRVEGNVGTVTATVTDAEAFTGAVPGDPISLTVRDNGTKDVIAFGSREQVERKCQAAAGQALEITRGDFRLGR